MSLDLSHNELCNLPSTLWILKNLKNLRMLGVDGNPFCLLRKWRQIILEDLRMLRVIDLEEIKEQDHEDINGKEDTYESMMKGMWGEDWVD